MSSGNSSKLPANPLLLILLFGIMAWIGWFTTRTLVWAPVSTYFAARSWQETTCTVQDSGIGRSMPSPRERRRNRNTTPTTRVEVTYMYSWGGKEYSSSRYDFIGAYTSGEHEAKREILNRYPKGARIPCWVDPDDPREAVINRDFSASYLVGSLFSLFLVAGVGGIGWTLFHVSGGAERSRERRKARRGDKPEDAEPQELKPRVSAARTFIGGSIVAAVWNGLIWYAVTSAWEEGDLNGCLVIFFIPFVLVGLLLIWGSIAPSVMLFNPRLHVTLSRTRLKPGQAAILKWRVNRKPEKIRRLRVLLHAPQLGIALKYGETEDDWESEVEAELRNGEATGAEDDLDPDQEADETAGDTILVFETDQPMLIAEGTAEVRIPKQASFLFDQENEDVDELVWTLETRCEIPGWVDSVEEHKIIVKR